MAPGEFVTVSVLPLVAKLALPLTTAGPFGFACDGDEAKQSATATPISGLRTPGPCPTLCYPLTDGNVGHMSCGRRDLFHTAIVSTY